MTIHFTVTFEESSYTAIESDKFVTVCLQRLDLIAKSIVVNLTTCDNISVGKFLFCGYTSYMGAIYRYIPITYGGTYRNYPCHDRYLAR